MAIRCVLKCAIASVLASPLLMAADPPQPSYEEVLAQVKKSDSKVDFLRLRMAFTETKLYDEIQGLDRSRREQTKVYFNVSRPFSSLKKKHGK